MPFAQGFERVTNFQKNLFFATLLVTAISTACFIAPTATHRLRFHKRDRKYVIESANTQIIVGLVFLSLAILGAVTLITDFLFDGSAALGLAGADRDRDRHPVVRAPARAHGFIRPLAARCHNGSPMKRLLILGSTGSIGTQALDVLA